MRKFIITNPTRWQGEIEMGFNTDEVLVFIHIRNNMDKLQLIKVLHAMPTTLAGIDIIKKLSPTAIIIEVPKDLSFDAFYNDYGYKRNRFRAEKLWAKMSDANRLQAITNVPQYRNYLNRKNIFQMLADTYLADRHYETNWNSIQ